MHVEKVKGNLTGRGQHIDRERVPKNADPAKQRLNAHLIEPKEKLTEAINERIEQGYTGKKEIRKDAVKALSFILTGSHDQMKAIEKDPEALKAWVAKNYYFLQERYGQENIVRFSLHRDERTPHIHAIVVPLTKDGRLSAKEVLGGPQDMKALQDAYAERMQPFGLNRGMENSPAKHTDVREFYALARQPEGYLPEIPEKGLLESGEKYKQRVAQALTPIFAEIQEYRRTKRSNQEALKQQKDKAELAVREKSWAREQGKQEGINATKSHFKAVLAQNGLELTPEGQLIKKQPKNDQKRDFGLGK